jgi:hypothetical protein
MSNKNTHSKRSQRSFNANNGVKKLFMAMAFKRKEEQDARIRARVIKEMLSKKDFHVGDVEDVNIEN